MWRLTGDKQRGTRTAAKLGQGFALLLSGLMLPLRIAVFFGALAVWHWPVLLALIVAAPRLVLMLPGLISTFLASRRHPRPRWSRFKPT